MKIPQWDINNLRDKLVDMLSTPVSPMSCDEYKWVWDTDNDTSRMQFSVDIDENMDEIYIEIYDYMENAPITDLETDNPEQALQEARKFKSKYIDRT